MPYAIIGILLLIGLSGGASGNQQPKPAPVPVSTTQPVSSTGTMKPIPTNTNSTKNTPQSTSNGGYSASTGAGSVNTVPVSISSPYIKTLAVQNIEYNRALLRTSVNTYSSTVDRVFFVYGYNQKQVTGVISQYKTFTSIPKFTGTAVQVVSVATKVKGEKTLTRSIGSLSQDTSYYYAVCIETISTPRFSCGPISVFKTTERDPRSNNFRLPSATTGSVTSINAYDALIEGKYNVNDAEYATAFFVYGESNTEVSDVSKEYDSYSDIKTNKENLQKIRMGVGLKGTGSYERVIDDLERGTKYYYRFCIAYDGDEDGLVCGSVRNLTTDARDKDVPTVSVQIVQQYGTWATIKSTVRMNDFLDGRAFLLYGSDEKRLQNITETTSFSRINQSGDSLQKIALDEDLDGQRTLQRNIVDLIPLTKYYYKVCVEYESENDRGSKALYLACSAQGLLVTGI